VTSLGTAGLDQGHTASYAACLAYRQQPFHGHAFWLYTIGAGRLQPAMQPDEVSLANLDRMTNMIIDLDSFGALRSSPRL
jgi:hypothetical protein